MLTKIIIGIAVTIGTSIVGTITYFYITMSNTIKDQKIRILELENNISNSEVAMAIKDANIGELKQTIEKHNNQITTLKRNISKKQKEFDNWKKLEAKDKYTNQDVAKLVDSASKNTCESIKSTLQQIGKLEYADLK